MVDKPGQVPTFSSVNDGVLIDPEQIAASNALLLVSLLPHVSDDLKKEKTDTPIHESVVYHYCPTHTPGKHQEQPVSPSEPQGQFRGNNQLKSSSLTFLLHFLVVCLTCLMIWPTYSITISSAAIGSIANRPHSWMWLRLKRILFFRNWYEKIWRRVSWQNETFATKGSNCSRYYIIIIQSSDHSKVKTSYCWVFKYLTCGFFSVHRLHITCLVRWRLELQRLVD